jgi:hypothetical protein
MAGDKSFAGMRGPKSDGAPGSWASDKVKNMMKVRLKTLTDFNFQF